MQGQLEIDLIWDAVGRRVIVLRGEIDIATADELRAALQQACSESTREVVVDLRALAFMDSFGVRTLAEGRDLCAANECEYILIRPRRGIVRRVLAISGLDDDPSFPNLPDEDIERLSDSTDDPAPSPSGPATEWANRTQRFARERSVRV